VSDNGDVHDAKPAPSTSHSKRARSVAAVENSNVAVRTFSVVPSGPAVIENVGAVTSTVNDIDDVPVLPAASVWDAVTVFEPLPRPLNDTDQAPPDTDAVLVSEPIVTDTDAESVVVPMIVTDEPVTAPGAGDTIATTGAVASTVHERDTMAETFPAVSTARTRRVCEPSDRPERANGEAHTAKPEPSSSHSKRATSVATDEKANDAVRSDSVVLSGPDENVTTGATRSTDTVTDDEVPVLFAASVCDAEIVYEPVVRPVKVADQVPLLTATDFAVWSVIDTDTFELSDAVPVTVTDDEPNAARATG